MGGDTLIQLGEDKSLPEIEENFIILESRKQIVSVKQDTIVFYDIETMEPVKTIGDADGSGSNSSSTTQFKSACLSKDECMLFINCTNGDIKIWNIDPEDEEDNLGE